MLASFAFSLLPCDLFPGTSVTTVLAHDDDGAAPNNEVIYMVSSGAKDKFHVNDQSGLITVESAADLDRDLHGDLYILTLLAIDRGTPPLTGSATVNVTITDVNNKFPEFLPDERYTQVPEDAPVGTVFLAYEAVDQDLNAVLRYALLGDAVYGEDENNVAVDDKDYLKVGVMQYQKTIWHTLLKRCLKGIICNMF